MTNVELLQQTLEASGLGPVVIASAWRVSLPTYYKLKAGEREFTASQIQTTAELLNLSRDLRDRIFFAD